RADRPGALHAACRARRALARAHHGRGADDGRRGGDRAAGAGAVPAAAALLHPGVVAGERQGMNEAVSASSIESSSRRKPGSILTFRVGHKAKTKSRWIPAFAGMTNKYFVG